MVASGRNGNQALATKDSLSIPAATRLSLEMSFLFSTDIATYETKTTEVETKTTLETLPASCFQPSTQLIRALFLDTGTPQSLSDTMLPLECRKWQRLPKVSKRQSLVSSCLMLDCLCFLLLPALVVSDPYVCFHSRQIDITSSGQSLLVRPDTFEPDELVLV